MLRLFLFALFAILARATFAEVTIRVVTSEDAWKYRIVVEGFSQESFLALRRLPAEQLALHFKIFVEASGPPENTPSLLGDCLLDRKQLVFRPRYELLAGVNYRAEFRSPLRDQARTENIIRIPALAPKEKSKVVAIYPSASELPQNLLRFYLHFSAPMQQGSVYRFIEIRHENGTKLELPFLELSEELWDRSGTRLTLLLDPGRVKRGLVPREEDGAILEQGKKYRLTVDSRWPDAQGSPLGLETAKEFMVTREDFSQPKPLEWKVIVPVDSAPRLAKASLPDLVDSKPAIDAASLSLEVILPDPLDQALLERCIEVVDSNGATVLGAVTVSDQERRWTFSPNSRWKQGVYTLRIDPILEDVAGNSIARPFEVDLTEPAVMPFSGKTIRFEIP